MPLGGGEGEDHTCARGSSERHGRAGEHAASPRCPTRQRDGGRVTAGSAAVGSSTRRRSGDRRGSRRCVGCTPCGGQRWAGRLHGPQRRGGLAGDGGDRRPATDPVQDRPGGSRQAPSAAGTSPQPSGTPACHRACRCRVLARGGAKFALTRVRSSVGAAANRRHRRRHLGPRSTNPAARSVRNPTGGDRTARRPSRCRVSTSAGRARARTRHCRRRHISNAGRAQRAVQTGGADPPPRGQRRESHDSGWVPTRSGSSGRDTGSAATAVGAWVDRRIRRPRPAAAECAESCRHGGHRDRCHLDRPSAGGPQLVVRRSVCAPTDRPMAGEIIRLRTVGAGDRRDSGSGTPLGRSDMRPGCAVRRFAVRDCWTIAQAPCRVAGGARGRSGRMPAGAGHARRSGKPDRLSSPTSSPRPPSPRRPSSACWRP
jgi:hypothetical protein